jgi:glycine/D-amino acid oxidase-like deaminating enzyme
LGFSLHAHEVLGKPILCQGFSAVLGENALAHTPGQVPAGRGCRERFEELKRSASMAKVFDLPVHVVTPQEIKELANIVNVDDVVGGIHIPSDGYANAVDITQALAKDWT